MGCCLSVHSGPAPGPIRPRRPGDRTGLELAVVFTSQPALVRLASDATSEPSPEPSEVPSHRGNEHQSLNHHRVAEELAEQDENGSTLVQDFEHERQHRRERRKARQARRAQRWRLKTINRWVSQSAYVIVDRHGSPVTWGWRE